MLSNKISQMIINTVKKLLKLNNNIHRKFLSNLRNNHDFGVKKVCLEKFSSIHPWKMKQGLH